MRARVGFQGFAIAALIIGFVHANGPTGVRAAKSIPKDNPAD